ncbi:ficolin-2-like [Lucilia cuprina]|uniref:ficolin-2-like n=1 Tax=Lucilia cuprina TaxID=7375 RepID=UPI001F069785|nr:ficolin-2-like [Lucilia cuprina]
MNFLIILFILAVIQNIKSEIASESPTPATNGEVIVKTKISKKKEEESQPAAVSVASTNTTKAATPTPLSVKIKVYDDSGVKKNISDLSERQVQQELFLKQLFNDVAFIKRSLIKIVNQNPDWTVIQRRQDGSEDFYRTWDEYKEGFGNPHGEFFIGLDNLYEMTAAAPQELLIILEDFENQTRYAKYDRFVLGSEDDKFTIVELGEYSGNAGDSMTYHKGRKFSTKDQDNDNNPTSNCAKDYKGAWWFDNCYSSHLNGPYFRGKRSCRGGINWYQWHNYMYSLKFVEIMVRPIAEEEE